VGGYRKSAAAGFRDGDEFVSDGWTMAYRVGGGKVGGAVPIGAGYAAGGGGGRRKGRSEVPAGADWAAGRG